MAGWQFRRPCEVLRPSWFSYELADDAPGRACNMDGPRSDDPPSDANSTHITEMMTPAGERPGHHTAHRRTGCQSVYRRCVCCAACLSIPNDEAGSVSLLLRNSDPVAVLRASITFVILLKRFHNKLRSPRNWPSPAENKLLIDTYVSHCSFHLLRTQWVWDFADWCFSP